MAEARHRVASIAAVAENVWGAGRGSNLTEQRLDSQRSPAVRWTGKRCERRSDGVMHAGATRRRDACGECRDIQLVVCARNECRVQCGAMPWVGAAPECNGKRACDGRFASGQQVRVPRVSVHRRESERANEIACRGKVPRTRRLAARNVRGSIQRDVRQAIQRLEAARFFGPTTAALARRESPAMVPRRVRRGPFARPQRGRHPLERLVPVEQLAQRSAAIPHVVSGDLRNARVEYGLAPSQCTGRNGPVSRSRVLPRTQPLEIVSEVRSRAGSGRRRRTHETAADVRIERADVDSEERRRLARREPCLTLIVESTLINHGPGAKVSDERRTSMPQPTPTAHGLEGIVAADTALSDVDGERGRLVLCGHDAESIAPTATFEDALFLFRVRRLPTQAERAIVAAELGAARVRAHAFVPALGRSLDLANPMDGLRASVAQLPGLPSAGESVEDHATLVAAATAVFAAAWSRRRAGAAPIEPDPGRGHASDYLRMLGIAPIAAVDLRARALDSYLVTVSDHGMNASTFAARVVASTGSDTVSAVVAAIGALKGPLHGGAPGPVIDMLDAIRTPDLAEAWVRAEVAAGRRIMGMGHRVYRVRDPRAAVLEHAIERLEHDGVRSERLTLARAVERVAERVLAERHAGRALKANVEFYTAVLLEAVGIPRELFTPTFAVGRVVGWLAHVQEQRATGRLIRPASRYVGAAPGA